MRISDDPAMRAVEHLALKAAACRANVLLEGESGVGKAFIARRIHQASSQAGRGFFSLFCLPGPDGWLGSSPLAEQLDGLVRDHGTVYLRGVDLVGKLGQQELLAYLDQRDSAIETCPHGSRDFARLIFSSQHHLRTACERGRFLRQLYLRVSVITIEVPPLRLRETDILSLANHFLSVYARRESKTIRGLTPDAAHLLRRMAWEGNIHQLKNAMNQAVVMADDGQMLSAGVLRGVLAQGCA
jgi:DNA-binding NtrC family response regulator